MKNTLLIVDDNPILTELFDELLNESFNIRVANSVAEALTELGTNNIDGIISDYHLGAQNAEVLIAWILDQQPSLINKFILITGGTSADLNLHKDIFSILYKPVEIGTLLSTVESFFDQKQEAQV